MLKTITALKAALRELGSQQDRNFLVETDAGRFVLKICRTEYQCRNWRRKMRPCAIWLQGRHAEGSRATAAAPATDIIAVDVRWAATMSAC